MRSCLSGFGSTICRHFTSIQECLRTFVESQHPAPSDSHSARRTVNVRRRRCIPSDNTRLLNAECIETQRRTSGLDERSPNIFCSGLIAWTQPVNTGIQHTETPSGSSQAAQQLMRVAHRGPFRFHGHRLRGIVKIPSAIFDACLTGWDQPRILPTRRCCSCCCYAQRLIVRTPASHLSRR